MQRSKLTTCWLARSNTRKSHRKSDGIMTFISRVGIIYNVFSLKCLKVMRKFICRLFNLYSGELQRSFLFILLAFSWAFCASCSVTLFDALFIVNVGACHLPIIYVYTAGVHFILASLFIYALHKFSFNNIYITTLVIGILIYSYFFIHLHINHSHISQTTWYILKILGVITLVVLTSCYWNFVDQYYDLQDAKRFYGLFSAASFLGMACGGITISLGFKQLQVQGLIFIILAMMFISALIAHYISTKTKVIQEECHEETDPSNNNSFYDIIKAIITSRFTLFLVITEMTLYLLEMVTEYNYMNTLETLFSTNAGFSEDAITIFLGKCKTWTSVGCIAFTTLFYSRFVKRFGVGNIYLTTPTTFFLIFLYWPFANGILIVILSFVAIEGVRTVIDDNCSNLMLNVVPHKIRSITRVMIDSFFEPAAVLVSGLLLMMPQVQSKILGLCLSIVALMGVLLLRGEYPKIIFTSLIKNVMNFKTNTKRWIQKLTKKESLETKKYLVSLLSHLDIEPRMLAYECLLAFNDKSVLSTVLNHMDSLPTELKLRALQTLEKSPFSKDQNVFDALYRWQQATSFKPLISVITFHFAKNGLFHPEQAIKHINDTNLTMHGAAIIALKSSWTHLSPNIATQNRVLASKHLKNLIDSSLPSEVCMALTILGLEQAPYNANIILPFLKSKNLDIARTAAKSMNLVLEEYSLHYIQEILSLLVSNKDHIFRKYCLKALGKTGTPNLVKDIIISSIHFRPNDYRVVEEIIIKMGLRTIPVLISITKDSSMHVRSRILAAKILGALSLPQLQTHLLEIVQQEIMRAYFCFYHAHTIQQQYLEHDLSILIETLLSAFNSIIDFIIHLLGISGAIDDVELLVSSLHSSNQKIHSHAVETIEKTCNPKIFHLLEPLIDDRPVEEKIDFYSRKKQKKHSLREVLDILEVSSSLAKHIIAASLKAQLNVPNWQKSLRQQMKNGNEIFQHFAYELLNEATDNN